MMPSLASSNTKNGGEPTSAQDEDDKAWGLGNVSAGGEQAASDFYFVSTPHNPLGLSELPLIPGELVSMAKRDVGMGEGWCCVSTPKATQV